MFGPQHSGRTGDADRCVLRLGYGCGDRSSTGPVPADRGREAAGRGVYVREVVQAVAIHRESRPGPVVPEVRQIGPDRAAMSVKQLLGPAQAGESSDTKTPAAPAVTALGARRPAAASHHQRGHQLGARSGQRLRNAAADVLAGDNGPRQTEFLDQAGDAASLPCRAVLPDLLCPPTSGGRPGADPPGAREPAGRPRGCRLSPEGCDQDDCLRRVIVAGRWIDAAAINSVNSIALLVFSRRPAVRKAVADVRP